MPKYQTSSNNRGRKILIGTVLVSLVIITVAFFSGSLTPAKDLQGVISSLPNDKLLGLSNFLSSENSKNQDELLSKIEKLNKKLFQAQEAKINKLEEQNKLILQELKLLKTPPSSASIRDKLTYLYPFNSESKFPAYIWQSWKHGLNDERFDDKFRQGESQWAFKNPGFVHELFNDDTAHTVIKYLYSQIPEVIETFELLPEIIMKMDFFKYLILYAKGGVYADIDTYPLQPIPNWTPENVSPLDIGMIIAIESDSSSPDWRKEQIRRLQFGQFVIQAKPGHPILREAIAQIIEQTKVKKLESLEASGGGGPLRLIGNTNEKSLKISQWTGSAIWTDVVLKYFNDYIQSSVFQKVTWKEFHKLQTPKLVSDVLVLPVKSFASDVEVSKDGKIEDPLAFVKHYAAKIWKSG
ncbi:Glycosyltransferase sugar-binding region containing DXD motif family protein [Candida parapsilosis]|uniref:Glycosyltransferase sugar-binding region containing DXD motif family protein n=1 Tax=Candida parapsilosis TaxID=5480 RepID=A0A8X7NI81_CANPA|nr:Glycosyltransferase sugar-binding region containing DXD motif family protein [Candida parapsilosis]KAF6044012.1 Glycosyltransferase sugar-binding region containing DXD motif family protein [Candida parapsilosis]KAF6045368.1 Glycosyltransferase sugar-binding region containing DXD motif family protein [Candida parapsilosis]KAF6060154.1 Glycosyltransferase sugar-binding region containing DXD motif family protein [Candida parapsilosis]